MTETCTCPNLIYQETVRYAEGEIRVLERWRVSHLPTCPYYAVFGPTGSAPVEGTNLDRLLKALAAARERIAELEAQAA